ncbi:18576_t:CDS:2, partial [Funneliformis geosporum]
AESTDELSDEGSMLWCTEELENNVKETLQLLMNADSIFENENSLTISESSQASEDEFNPQTDDQESNDDEDFNKKYLLSDNELIKKLKIKLTNILKAGGNLPESFRERHPKIKSILENEDIQAEIVLFLCENKFEFYIADF